VKLPANGRIAINGYGQNVTIILQPDAVIRNMQDNSTAFEGWSLGLKRWCKVESITLRWNIPSDLEIGQSHRRHYERFLYRVAQFKSLFPEWFVIGPSDFLSLSTTRGKNKLFLNTSGKRTKSVSAIAKHNPEHELEMKLLRSPEFLRHYKLSDKSIVDRQFPVGLFSSSIAKKTTQVFPAGKGAIDLVCLDGSVFWLFELKAARNLSVGTITELIFYTSIVRDAVGGRIQLASNMDSKIRIGDVEKVTKIVSVMLGHNLHPLLADPAVIELLNDAANRHWNEHRCFPQVSFRAGEIESDEPLKIRAIA